MIRFEAIPDIADGDHRTSQPASDGGITSTSLSYSGP
jgi:hypothetical protein